MGFCRTSQQNIKFIQVYGLPGRLSEQLWALYGQDTKVHTQVWWWRKMKIARSTGPSMLWRYDTRECSCFFNQVILGFSGHTEKKNLLQISKVCTSHRSVPVCNNQGDFDEREHSLGLVVSQTLKISLYCWSHHSLRTQDLENLSQSDLKASTRELDFTVPIGAMEAAKGEAQSITLPMLMDNNSDVQHGKVSLEVQERHKVTSSCVTGLKDHTAGGNPRLALET